jgi:serine protease Do
LVAEPQANGPAAKAGIESGDVITAVNGETVKDARELARTIGGIAPGNAVKLNVLHKGQEKVINLTLGQLPNTIEAKADNDDGDKGGATRGTDVPKLGLTVAPANSVAGAGKEGVVITEVDPKSAAAERGFKEGDVILEVGGKSVASAGDVRDAINAARTDNKNSVLMRVKSGASSQCPWPRAEEVLRDGGCRRHQSPPPTALSGERAKSRSLLLPSGGIRPPPSEGSKGGEVPQLHRPLFSLNGAASARLA